MGKTFFFELTFSFSFFRSNFFLSKKITNEKKKKERRKRRMTGKKKCEKKNMNLF